MDVGVPAALGFVEAVPTREDHVGDAEQLAFELLELWRGEAEIRQLVHAIVDGADGMKVARKGEHQGGVVPADNGAGAGRGELAEQRRQVVGVVILRTALRKNWRDHRDAVLGVRSGLQSGAALVEEWLFPENDPQRGGEALHQVLRPLVDEVPPQV